MNWSSRSCSAGRGYWSRMDKRAETGADATDEQASEATQSDDAAEREDGER